MTTRHLRNVAYRCLAVLMLVGTSLGWGGEKVELPFERAALIDVSNVGRPMDHLVCDANRMLQLHNSKLAVILWINNRWGERSTNQGPDRDYKGREKDGKARILRAEQREGYNASLVIVLDPKANYYRTSDPTSLPEGWAIAAVDANGKIQFLEKGVAVPQGGHMVHGIGGLPLPSILKSER
jgi:hypothetical protein